MNKLPGEDFSERSVTAPIQDQRKYRVARAEAQRLILTRFRKREKGQLRHGEVFSVVGQEREPVGEGNGRDGHVGVGKGMAF
jgi:hypothetical protein